MGHPDKVADQISDAILDAILAQDPKARVACETLVTTGQVVLAGEVTTDRLCRCRPGRPRHDQGDRLHPSRHRLRLPLAAACSPPSTSQSPDIARGVDKAEDDDKEQGAGDQGLMFGYATR